MSSENNLTQGDDPPVRRNIIAGGLKLFIVCTIIGWAVMIVMVDGIQDSLSVFAGIDWGYACIFLTLTIIGLLLGGARTWYIACAIDRKVPYFGCLKADLGNIFFGQMTPLQGGAAPAQLYLLNRAGLKLGEAMAVTLINFTFSMLVIFSLVGVLVINGAGVVTSGTLGYFLRYSFVFLGFLCSLIVLFRFRPKTLEYVLTGLKNLANKFHGGSGETLDLLLHRFFHQLQLLWDNLTFFWRRRPGYVLGASLFSLVLYGNKFTIGYFIVRSLGIEVNFWDVFNAMAILQAIMYFSPSPGASGIAEIAAGSIMSMMLPTAYLLPFTILWRVCMSYLGILVGAMVLSRDISDTVNGLVHWKGKIVSA